MRTGRYLRSQDARRLLIAIPGLIAPLVLLGRALRLLTHEWEQYYALPIDIRNDPDPGPIGADTGLQFATLAIVYALLLFLPPLLVALPRRLRFWMAILAIILLLPAALVLIAFLARQTTWGAVALLSLVYIVVLAVTRLVQQVFRAPVGTSASSPEP